MSKLAIRAVIVAASDADMREGTALFAKEDAIAVLSWR
jgi:hypothetical protein